MREEIQDTKEIKMDPITLAQEIIDGTGTLVHDGGTG